MLLKQLHEEKKASNVGINNSMAEARTTMSEALRIIRGPVNMGLALGAFIDKLKDIIADPKLVLRESFMMSMFAKFLTDLPPMKAYWNHIFKKDKVRMICRNTGATIVHLVGVKDEAFVPKQCTNRRAAP